MTIESREVLADAYRVWRPESMLRHAVVVDSTLLAVRVMCGRVRLDNLADRNAGDPHEPPTCRTCIAAVNRHRAKEGSPDAHPHE